MLVLSIPKPCQEKWEEMTVGDGRRFCHSCSKHVIDFSSMNNAEVANYFLNNQNKHICGRYRNDQLNTPLLTISEEIFYKKIPIWQKFLAILLITFSTTLFGCKTELRSSDKISDVPVQTIPIAQLPATEQTDKPIADKPLEKIETMIMGMTLDQWTYIPTLLPDKLRPANKSHKDSTIANQ